MHKSRIEQIIEHEAAADSLELKAADEHKWEAARLIAEELESGTIIREVAKAIGKNNTHVFCMAKCWKLREFALSEKTFNKFYNSERVRGSKKPKKAKPETKAPDSFNGATIELSNRKVIKLELTPKEFKIFNRGVNPQCHPNERRNCGFALLESLTVRYPMIKEIPQPY